MIRRRKASVDDKKLRRIMAEELIPQTRRLFPNFRTNARTLTDRLNKGYTFVAQEGRRSPYGFVTLLMNKEDAYIDMIAVERHAMNRGIGSALLQHAEEYASLKGCSRCSLYVEETNDPVCQFYLRRGYEIVRHVPQLHCYFLWKPLR